MAGRSARIRGVKYGRWLACESIDRMSLNVYVSLDEMYSGLRAEDHRLCTRVVIGVMLEGVGLKLVFRCSCTNLVSIYFECDTFEAGTYSVYHFAASDWFGTHPRTYEK